MNKLLTALALSALIVSVPAHAASHCKGIAEAQCTSAKACRWMPERKVGDMTKKGTPALTGAKAHCRLDVKRAGEIASKQ